MSVQRVFVLKTNLSHFYITRIIFETSEETFKKIITLRNSYQVNDLVIKSTRTRRHLVIEICGAINNT